MESNASNNSKVFCEIHPKKSIQFVCLDSECSKAAHSCLLCIKNFHKNCKDEFIIHLEELNNKVNIAKPEIHNEKIVQRINEILERKFHEFKETLNHKRKVFIEALKVDQDSQKLMVPGVLENVKNNFDIEYDESTDKININSKFDAEPEEIENSIKNVEKHLEKEILAFIKYFETFKLSIPKKLNADDWVKSPDILIENDSGGLIFKRAPEDSTCSYFCALYTIPIEVPSKFKITIQSIEENDRFLDFGIVTKSGYDTIIDNNFIKPFGSSGISYCGYACTGGLSGAYLTSDCYDEKGFRPGVQCTMEYIPNEVIKFYNEDKTIDMSMSMEDSTETYYLFLVIFHPETSCFLERFN